MQFLRKLIFVLICKLIAFLILGLNVKHRERLQIDGPGIVVANHNSHLDTLILLCLFPARVLPRLRPVAAADYFLKTSLSRWFSLNIIGILPIHRKCEGRSDDPLQGCYEALEAGEILILFPEGSRGEPEQMSDLKSGIARLSEKFPAVPVVPVFLQGAGRALPKGKPLLVPFLCHVIVGDALTWGGDKSSFMISLKARLDDLAGEAPPLYWE